MKTVTLQIGNTDDKLTQEEWANYVADMRAAIMSLASQTHFFGGASNWDRWQNVAWIVVCGPGEIEQLKTAASAVRKQYRQDSVAWLVGDTEFI